MAKIILKRGRSKPVQRRHPWIFSGAIERIKGDIANGGIVEVHDVGNNWLARGYLNQHSQIRVRLLTWQQEESIDRAFWRRRLERAIAARQPLAHDSSTTAYRLVHAESDYLPGLIVDRYGEWLVVQFLTLGVERRKEELIDLLTELVKGIRGIYERSDVDVREKENLKQQAGSLRGEKPPRLVEVLENGHRFLVDVRQGHKTGLYLDQRETRSRLSAFCNTSGAGAEVLDAFAYTGGFSIYALANGASQVTLVESSAPALDLARRNFALNDLSDRKIEYAEDNVFSLLRGYRAQERRFDLVVLDPPKFAHTKRDVKRAARGYKDINLLAFQLLRPGGVLFTCSCSGAVSADLFQKIVFGAALDRECPAQIIGRLTQSADHPVALTFPEGTYLKGLIVRKVHHATEVPQC